MVITIPETLATSDGSAPVPAYNVFPFSGKDAGMAGILAMSNVSLANNVNIAASGNFTGIVDNGLSPSQLISNVLFTGLQVEAARAWAQQATRQTEEQRIERQAQNKLSLDKLIAQTELEAAEKRIPDRFPSRDTGKGGFFSDMISDAIDIGAGLSASRAFSGKAPSLSEPSISQDAPSQAAGKFASLDLSAFADFKSSLGGSMAVANTNIAPNAMVAQIQAPAQGMGMAA